MPTQLNARTCNMDRLQALADKYRLQIVEDAAQALGEGRPFGLWSTPSFPTGLRRQLYPAAPVGLKNSRPMRMSPVRAFGPHLLFLPAYAGSYILPAPEFAADEQKREESI